MPTPRVQFPSDRLEEFCRRRRVRRLSLFGSVLRDDFRPDSDVDVLVEFEPGAPMSLFTILQMEEELSQMIGGHKVDLRTREDLSRYFRETVVRGAVTQYAA